MARTAALTCATLALAACHDPPGGPDDGDPTSGPLQLVVAPDTPVLTQRGVDLRVSARDGSMVSLQQLLIDADTPASRDATGPFASSARNGTFLPELDVAAFVDGPGVHRITVVALDARGRTLSASVTRTFEIADAPYATTMRPDLDAGGSVYLWRVGTARVSRVRLPNDAWRVDSLGAVNGAGAVAASGVERATGRRAALLLTPAAGRQ